MSQMVVVTTKRKMLLRMSGVEMKDGVDAYFFRADESDCNGFELIQLTGKLCVYIIASDCNGKGDKPWAESKNTRSMPPNRSVS